MNTLKCRLFVRTDLGNQKVFLSRIHLYVHILRSSEPFFVSKVFRLDNSACCIIRLACMMSIFGVVCLQPETHYWFVFTSLNDDNN